MSEPDGEQKEGMGRKGSQWVVNCSEMYTTYKYYIVANVLQNEDGWGIKLLRATIQSFRLPL